MRRRIAPPLVFAAMLALPGAALSKDDYAVAKPKPRVERSVAAAASATRAERLEGRRLLRRIRQYQHVTWRWQRLMRIRRTPTVNSASRDPSLVYRRWVLRLWKRRALKTQRRAQRPPHRSAWRCIQSHEGAWNDPNPPYYGGLQMDMGFQQRYGAHLLRRKGTANNWTPLEQMWVAERAYRSGRGFYPWPNAARICGLI